MSKTTFHSAADFEKWFSAWCFSSTKTSLSFCVYVDSLQKGYIGLFRFDFQHSSFCWSADGLISHTTGELARRSVRDLADSSLFSVYVEE